MNKQQEPRLRFKGFTGEWQETTIGELGEIITGNTPATSESDNYENNGLLWITPTDIKESITIKTAKQLSEKGKKAARCLPPNSILITCIASIGKNTLIETYGSCNQQINALIPKKECNPYFLLTLSELWSIQMKKIAGSGTMDIVNKTQFSEIKTKLPSSEEQTHLGLFFRRLDSQIAESRAVLDKSRQLKKAMLAKMFPADGEKIPKIRFKGFDGEWERKKLGEIAFKVKEKNIAYQYAETFTNSAEFGIISQQDFFDKSISNSENIGGYYVVQPDDFVYNPRISSFAPVGPIKRNKLGRTGVMSPLYYVFRLNDEIKPSYLEQYFEGNQWHHFMYLNGDTGARSDRFSIKNDVFAEMPISFPANKNEQTAIGNFFRQLDETIALQSAEVEKLNQLKKGLLAAMLV